MKTALRRPAERREMRSTRRPATTAGSDRRCIDASRRSVQSSTEPRAHDGFPDRRLRLDRDRCFMAAAPSRDIPRAAHSRFVQRIRRRYAERARRCCRPGLPDRDDDRRPDRAPAGRRHAASPRALRIARQLTLERLAVLDIEAGAPLADITAGDDRARRGDARARPRAQALADQDARFGVPRDAAGERDRLLDRRHGQARRARAQRLVRHRPDLRLRGRRPDRRRRSRSARTSTSRRSRAASMR